MLTTLKRAKLLLGIDPTDTSRDDLLTALLEVSSQQIEDRCRRKFELQEHVQACSLQTAQPLIALDNYPIESVSSVIDARGESVTGFEILETGQLFRRDGWAPGMRTLTVTYRAGYVLPTDESAGTLPATIELACVLNAKHLLENKAGIVSERIDGEYTVTYAQDNMPLHVSVESLIKHHIRGLA